MPDGVGKKFSARRNPLAIVLDVPDLRNAHLSPNSKRPQVYKPKRIQVNKKSIFKNILKETDDFQFCMTNPPFHSSAKESLESSDRKWRNLLSK